MQKRFLFSKFKRVSKPRPKKHRLVCDSVLGVDPSVIGLPLASPFRRITAFLIDCLLLLLPSLAIAIAAAYLRFHTPIRRD